MLVTDSGVIRGLLCLMFGWDPARIMDIPVPCGSVTRLWTEGEGELLGRIEEAGVRPGRYPGREACLRLWDRYDLPDHIRAHEEAVAELACGWAGRICASTVFTKQHSIIDVACGLALVAVGYWPRYGRKTAAPAGR